MSNWGRVARRMEAAERRDERESRKRQKELDRRLKEGAKLSALEQARLEVEAHENALEVLLSVHKEQHPATDWRTFATSLPPHEPPRLARHELAALLKHGVSEAFQYPEEEAGLAAARSMDDQAHQAGRGEFEREFAHWERLNSLARRVLAGEPRAYTQAVSEFPNLAEISNLGSSIHMTVHDAKLVECVLRVNGRGVIPSDTKSLTAAGKVAIKPTPKSRFHELYQDYVCGCILRLAREIFALLPIDTVLLTATVDGIDARTGHAAELPVLSIAAPRAVLERLDFERLHPSDALENFQHRGDVMTSRKADTFLRIIPLTPEEITPESPETMAFRPLVAGMLQFSTELDKQLKPAISDTAESFEPSALTI